MESLSFLTPGNYPDDDPHSGLEEILQLFEFGEQQGFDGAWIRQRHLEQGVSSAAVFLAAPTQRTRHIQLGTAMIPIGYESPFRLDEDRTTADVLSRGRLQVGLSTGMPHAELMAHWSTTATGVAQRCPNYEQSCRTSSTATTTSRSSTTYATPSRRNSAGNRRKRCPRPDSQQLHAGQPAAANAMRA